MKTVFLVYLSVLLSPYDIKKSFSYFVMAYPRLIKHILFSDRDLGD